MASKKKKSSSKSSSSSSGKKVKSIVTNTKGQKVTSYTDGSKSYSGGSSSGSSSSSSSKNNSSNSSKAPTIDYNKSAKESISEYNRRIEKERAAVNAYNAKKTTTPTQDKNATPNDDESPSTPSGLSLKDLENSVEYKSLSSDEREAVRAVFMAIGENNIESAQRLVSAFKAATGLAEPFFKQKIRLAQDAVERGYVSIDKELDFEEQQAALRLQDLQEDVQARQEMLTLDEQNDLRAIERDYKQTLDVTRQNLAATGKSASSVRAETEQIIEETTGDLRESTKRSFGSQKNELSKGLTRGQRNTSAELQRLRELAKQKKTGLFRQAEETLGTKNLPSLNFDYKPLGDISGSLEEDRTNDIIGAVKNLF